MTKPGPSVTSGADTQPGSDSLFPSGFGGGAAVRAGGVGSSEIADGSVAAADLNLPSVAAAIAARAELTGAYAGIGRGFIPGNFVAALGDSITAYNNGARMETMNGGWFNDLVVRSLGRLRWTGIYATAGFTLAQIQSTHLPTVLALNPKPTACFVFGGSNDCSANGGVGYSLATVSATHAAICNSLKAAGISPIVVLIPPNSAASSATIENNVALFNAYLLRYAQRNGYPVLDAFTPLVNPTDGTFTAALTLDGTHPNALGHRTIAEWNLENLIRAFPPTGQPQTTWGETYNLVASSYGLFQADANSDGVADGWSVGNSPDGWTPSLVTPSAADGLVGKWQQIARSTSATKQGWLFYTLASGWSVGDVLEFSVRVQTEGLTAGGSNATVGTYIKDNQANAFGMAGTWTEDVPDGLLSFQFTVPSGATDLKVYLQVGYPTGQGCKVRFGQVTVRNLTAMTLATA